MGRTFGRFGSQQQSPRDSFMSSITYEVLGDTLGLTQRKGDVLTAEDKVDLMLFGNARRDAEAVGITDITSDEGMAYLRRKGLV